MKTLLFVVFGILATLIVAVLVLPSFIDWNDYKGEIASQVRALTGRDLSIDGDVRISVLPAPALVAQGVRVANVEGASEPDLMRLKSLEIRIALGPLLGGTVQVETVKLVDPIIHVERLPDGRMSWQLDDGAGSEPGAGPGSHERPGSAPPDPASQPSVRLDSFVIENGTVIYRDVSSGFSERVERLDAEIAAASLTGPFQSAGGFHLRGAQIDYAVTLGEIIHGRTVPINIRVDSPATGVRLDVSGALIDLSEEPRFRGKATVGGENLSAAVSSLLGKEQALPGWAAQPYGIQGSLTAGAAELGIEDIVASLGDTRATGRFALRLQPSSSFVAALDVKHINLDRWLGATGEANGRPAGVGDAKKDAGDEKPARNRSAEPSTFGFVLPEDLSGSLDVSVDVVTFRGSNIREIRVLSEISGGEVTVSQMSALLPGGSDIFASGFLTTPEGRPQFEGEVEAEVSDLRRVLAWLDVELPQTSPERLRRAAFGGQLTVTAERVEARQVDLTVDTSRLTGGIAIALRRRLAFGADFTIDRLNLDAYMPLSDEAKTAPDGNTVGGTRGSASSDAGEVTPYLPIPPLAALSGFDANLKLRVQRLTFRRIPITDILFDATLFDGTLEIRELSVADLADASGRTSGTISSLSEIPELDNLQFELRGGDLARLLRAFEIEPPGPAGELGTVVVKGQADGGILSPDLNVQISAAEATVGYAGRLPIQALGTELEARISMRHPDVARLLRALGADYRPRGRIGALSMSTQLKNQGSSWLFTDLAANIGEVTFAGSGRIDLSGDRPRLSTQLRTNEIVVDPFLPAERAASLWPPRRSFDPNRAILVPAAWRAGPVVPKPHAGLQTVQERGGEAGRWSDDEIDLSALNAIDAEVVVRSEALDYQGYRLEEADLAFDLSNGLLRIERLNGGLFGGSISGRGQLDASADNRLQATLEIEGAELAKAGPAIGTEGLTGGRLSAAFEGDAAGVSVSDLIGSLNGNGRFSLDQAKVSGGGAGPATVLFELIAGLNQIGGILGGGVRGDGLVDASATFAIEDGVASSNDLRLVSNVGEAEAEGTVDLPNWTVDMDGELAVANNIATQLLAGRTGVDLTVPMSVSGSLDAPSVKIDTAKIPGGVLRLPGEVLEGTGVEGILRQLIPGTPSRQ